MRIPSVCNNYCFIKHICLHVLLRINHNRSDSSGLRKPDVKNYYYKAGVVTMTRSVGDMVIILLKFVML